MRSDPAAASTTCTMPGVWRTGSAFPTTSCNFEERFNETVVRNFVSEYAAGRTPIPCVHCNADLKFDELVDRAAGFDATAVATGHYARVQFDEDGAPLSAPSRR